MGMATGTGPHGGLVVSPGTLTGDSKLPIGVNVSVYGCLSVSVSPVMNWRLSLP